ncbi:MAG: transposase [Ignavibacteria bacterium GWB2_35_6b]|nr:MAG: transposase [Ignavibacteria bacterium GWB2_35_6b]
MATPHERKVYDKEFKKETVRLIIQEGRRTSDVSKDLGINENVIYRWIRQYKADSENSFPGKGDQKPADEELRKLKKQLADVTEERDILKKAISIFSKIRQ